MPARLLTKFVKPDDASQAEDNCAANYTDEVPFRIGLTATDMEFTQWPKGDVRASWRLCRRVQRGTKPFAKSRHPTVA